MFDRAMSILKGICFIFMLGYAAYLGCAKQEPTHRDIAWMIFLVILFQFHSGLNIFGTSNKDANG